MAGGAIAVPMSEVGPHLPPSLQEPRVPLRGQQLQGWQRAGLGYNRGPL